MWRRGGARVDPPFLMTALEERRWGGFIAPDGAVKNTCEAAREAPKERPRVEETGRSNQLSLSITLKFCLGPRSPGDYRLCPKPDKYSFSIPDIERSGNG